VGGVPWKNARSSRAPATMLARTTGTSHSFGFMVDRTLWSATAGVNPPPGIANGGFVRLNRRVFRSGFFKRRGRDLAFDVKLVRKAAQRAATGIERLPPILPHADESDRLGLGVAALESPFHLEC